MGLKLRKVTLHLPRNLHFKVHKVVHFKVNKALHLQQLLKTSHMSKSHDSVHEVSLAPATKSDHHARKCARHHNESTVATSTRASPPDFASLRSRNALRGFREA